MNTILTILSSAILSIGSFLGIYDAPKIVPVDTPQVQMALGTSGILPIAGTTYTLSGSGVSSSATSLVLSSFTIPQTGQKISDADMPDTFYVTLEPGNRSRQEIVSCTTVTQNANNTATLSGCSRGLAPISPYTASTTLRFVHSGGSQVIISDPPQLFDSLKSYIDGQYFTGIGNASETATGTVEIATGAEAAASTETGSKGRLVIPATLATSTYNSATAANVIPVTGGTGKIDNYFIATTTLPTNLTLSGTTTVTATSSLKVGAFSAWEIGKQRLVVTTTGTSTFSVPSGITKIFVEVQGPGMNGANTSSDNTSGSGGGAGGYANEVIDVTGTSTIQMYVGAANGTRTTFGTIGSEYLTANGGLGGNADAVGGVGGSASGGDINIQGGQGCPTAYDGTNDYGGCGGSSRLGFGGATLFSSSNGASGIDSTGYGAGGGGCNGSTGNPCTPGVGGQGIIIIRW
jgi:hypothetical protein